MATFTEFVGSITYQTLRCGECDTHFAIDSRLYKERVEDGQVFWCPRGHERVFRDSDIERLRKEKARLTHALDQERAHSQYLNEQRQKTERSLRGTKAVVTRMKRRVTQGRCVCCSKQFKDLEKHMANQHPNFDPDKAAEALSK